MPSTTLALLLALALATPESALAQQPNDASVEVEVEVPPPAIAREPIVVRARGSPFLRPDPVAAEHALARDLLLAAPALLLVGGIFGGVAELLHAPITVGGGGGGGRPPGDPDTEVLLGTTGAVIALGALVLLAVGIGLEVDAGGRTSRGAALALVPGPGELSLGLALRL